MPEELNLKEWKSILWAIRFYALIIIAVLVVSDLTSWLAADTGYIDHHADGALHDHFLVPTVPGGT